MEDPPERSELGLAWIVTTGASALTVTVTDCVAKPPDPLHVSSYSVLLDKAPVDHLPLVATCPCQPPVAVHWSALLAFQISVELPRLLTVVGEATRVTSGAGCVTTTDFDGVLDCVAALASLMGFAEIRSPSQAARAAIAVNPSIQRNSHEARTLWERSRAQ